MDSYTLQILKSLKRFTAKICATLVLRQIYLSDITYKHCKNFKYFY